MTTLADGLKQFLLPLPFSGKVLKHLLKVMLFFMVVVFIADFMVQANAMLRSSSSTASVGFIFLPFLAVLTAFKAWVFAFALAYLITAFTFHAPKLNIFVLLCIGIIIQGVWQFSGDVLDVIKSKMVIYEINMLHDSTMLNDKFKEYPQFTKEVQPFVLEAIALNPYTSSETLDSIAKTKEVVFEKRLDSLFYFQPTNSKGFSVKRLVARHQNTSPETLRALSHTQDSSIVEGVIENEKTPLSILEDLTKSSDPAVRDAAKKRLGEREVKK